MKRIISVLFLCSAFIRYSNACPVCTVKVANNKAPFFSTEYYKPHAKENKRKQKEAKKESVEYGKRESKQRQTQEVEAENLAEQMGDL